MSGDGIKTPGPGQVYHSVYPGGAAGEEVDITEDDLDAYEAAAGHHVAWVYFSHNWFQGRSFPNATAEWIRQRGSVPFIRLMLRSSTANSTAPDPVFNLDAILSGSFDADLQSWARGACDFGTPLIVEYGTECNGRWVPWNGLWNGGADGPEKFVECFRRIVGLMRGEGASNITWVFHVNGDNNPADDWNKVENYYPRDDVVDWVGVSIYGPQTPTDPANTPFRDTMDVVDAKFRALCPAKPEMVLEFGCCVNSTGAQPAPWAGAALTDLIGGRWPNVKGFSWWNERWQNDGDPAHDTIMRLQDIASLAQTFREKLDAGGTNVVDYPILAK